jgi:hypothetical protein
MKAKCRQSAVFALLLVSLGCGGSSAMKPLPTASCTPSAKPFRQVRLRGESYVKCLGPGDDLDVQH